MHTKTLLLLPAMAFGLILLANCSPKTGKSASGTSSAMPDVHYTEAQLADGKAIFTSHCGKCHQLFQPEEKTVAKWNSVLPSMVKKAKLSDEQGNLVRAYVMANVKE